MPSAKAEKGIIDKIKNTAKIIDTRRFFIHITKGGLKVTDQNKERLTVIIWILVGMIATVFFWLAGLVCNIGLIVWLLYKMYH